MRGDTEEVNKLWEAVKGETLDRLVALQRISS